MASASDLACKLSGNSDFGRTEPGNQDAGRVGRCEKGREYT